MATGGKQVSPAVAVIVIIIVLAIIVAVYFWAAGKPKPTGAQPPMMKGMMNAPGKGPMGPGMPAGKGPMGPGMKVPVSPPTGNAPAPAPTGQ